MIGGRILRSIRGRRRDLASVRSLNRHEGVVVVVWVVLLIVVLLVVLSLLSMVEGILLIMVLSLLILVEAILRVALGVQRGRLRLKGLLRGLIDS